MTFIRSQADLLFGAQFCVKRKHWLKQTKNLFGRLTQVSCCCSSKHRQWRRCARHVCRWNNWGLNGSITCFENSLSWKNGTGTIVFYSFGLKHLSYQTRWCCTQRLQHKLIRVFDPGCLYWQDQQGIGHCARGGSRGGSGGGVCLVRNWFSLGLRQGWKVVALTMTPPQMSQWTFLCIYVQITVLVTVQTVILEQVCLLEAH